mgnify:CR=1 FL=1
MSDTYDQDRKEAADWAREMLASDALILDTETSGLDDTAEIVQIAIIDMHGNTLLDALIKPVNGIPRSASRIHGITDETVAEAPSFADVWPSICDVIRDKTVIIYNADYDTRLLAQSARAHGITLLRVDYVTYKCAMLPYSAWVGSWNDYHGNYRWQRLPAGDHSALGDCLATLNVLQKMAAQEPA